MMQKAKRLCSPLTIIPTQQLARASESREKWLSLSCAKSFDSHSQAVWSLKSVLWMIQSWLELEYG